MKSKLVALVTTAIAFALGAHAQTAIEYSHASSAGAGAAAGMGTTSKALGAASNRIAEKLNAAGKATSHSSGSATTKGTALVQEMAAPAKQPLAKPGPPAVFILSSGEKIESSNYFLTVDSLRVEQNGTPRTIPMSNVNVDATTAANHRRGINLKFPSNKAQIMVSF